MRIYGLVQDSIVDGPGMRFVCFVQGCPHHCPGCHNPDSHDFDGGTVMTTDELIEQMLSNPLTSGLTLSGGEPFAQAEDCLTIARAAHAHGLHVMAYTGWTYEHLLHDGSEAQRALLEEVDVLVDGPFILAERTLNLPWRGSRNQRVIDLREVQNNGRKEENTGDDPIVPDPVQPSYATVNQRRSESDDRVRCDLRLPDGLHLYRQVPGN